MSDHAAPDVGDTIADGISNAVPGRISEHLAMGEIVESVLEELKQNGYTIAPAGDVLTAEDRAAIGRMWNWAEAESADAYELDPQTESDMTRLRKLAAGGTA